MDIIWDMLNSFGGGALVVSALSIWCGNIWMKRIIQSEKLLLDLRLEAEKTRLQEQLESLKSEFLIENKLMEIRYGSINDQRVKALVTNYQMPADAWLDCRWAIQPDEIGRHKPSPMLRLDKAADTLDSYYRDFERNKIFLSEKSKSEIYKFHSAVWESLNELRIFGASNASLETRLEQLYGKWIDKLSPMMEDAREAIEFEYKVIIGINEHNEFL
ncbi:TPA: hypothetical protein ACQQJD_004911 [Pseudomonas aeruginosa]